MHRIVLIVAFTILQSELSNLTRSFCVKPFPFIVTNVLPYTLPDDGVIESTAKTPLIKLGVSNEFPYSYFFIIFHYF